MGQLTGALHSRQNADVALRMQATGLLDDDGDGGAIDYGNMGTGTVNSAPHHVQSHCHSSAEIAARAEAKGMGIGGQHVHQHAMPARHTTTHLPASVRAHHMHRTSRQQGHERTHHSIEDAEKHEHQVRLQKKYQEILHGSHGVSLPSKMMADTYAQRVGQRPETTNAQNQNQNQNQNQRPATSGGGDPWND